jgi:hypothetical protein
VFTRSRATRLPSAAARPSEHRFSSIFYIKSYHHVTL